MTSCLARWIVAAGLACLCAAVVSPMARAEERQDDAVAAPPAVLFPFYPAYRSRPPREPAELPATSPKLAAPVQEPMPAASSGEPQSNVDAGASESIADGVEGSAGSKAGVAEADDVPADDMPADDMPADADGPGSETQPAEDQPAQAEVPRRELSPAMTALRDRVRATLAFHRSRALSASSNSATEIMAACLAFGCETSVLRGDQAGNTINGITHLCWNYPCDGYVPLTLVDGHVAARLGYGQQEHPSQLLATLAMARVKPDYPVRVGEDVRSVADLVEGEKLRCRAEADLSFTLVGMACYVTDDSTWHNDLGEEWSVERMIREELDKPVVTAADGGLNRLMGLSYAVHRRKKSEQPIDGQYLRAEKFVREFQEYAFRLQASDGSWGPWFLSAQGSSRDPVENLRGTGHVLEWLALSLPEEEVEDPRVIRAMEYVVSVLNNRRYQGGVRTLGTREIDSVMHALHALAIYDERVFQPADPPPAEEQAPAQDGKEVASRRAD